MKVKVIRAFLNGNDVAMEGTVIDVSVPRSQDLEKRGLVVPTIGGGNENPFPQRQLGGQIGGEKVVPSLQEDQVQKIKPSKKRKGGAKS